MGMRLVLACLALLLLAAPAGASEVVDRDVAGPLVSAPSAHFVAYIGADGRLAIQPEIGKVQRFPVDADCRPDAASRTLVALACGESSDAVSVLDTRTGRVAPVDVSQAPGIGVWRVIGVGRRWVQVMTDLSDGSPKAASAEALINRATGRVIDLREDPFGAHNRIALDRERPAVPLCPGARRAPARSSQVDDSAFWPTTVAGRWVLTPVNDLDVKVFDCDRRTWRQEPRDYAYYRINATHLVAAAPVTGPSRLTRLAPQRTSPFDAGTSIALSAGALWVVRADGVLTRRTL